MILRQFSTKTIFFDTSNYRPCNPAITTKLTARDAIGENMKWFEI